MKFYGKVGFETTVETRPGIWEPQVVERIYRGDVDRVIKRIEGTDQVNDNITLNHMIRIVADTFAENNFFAVKYVEWGGAKWRVSSVEYTRPRLTLYIGKVYNE